MYEIESVEFPTIWGFNAKMNFRKGTTDRMTAYAVMVADEYKAKELYRETQYFIDIGSHIGTWGILMGIKYRNSRVLCYEPIPENYRMIYMNKIANDLENLYAYMLAVSDTAYDDVEISYTDDSTKFGKEHKFIGSMQGGSGKKIMAKTASLNDILWGVDNCVIKTDCEGCEVKAFASLEPENFKKIDYIIGEFHPWGMSFDTFYGLFKNTHKDISEEWHENHNLRNFIFKRRGL